MVARLSLSKVLLGIQTLALVAVVGLGVQLHADLRALQSATETAVLTQQQMATVLLRQLIAYQVRQAAQVEPVTVPAE